MKKILLCIMDGIGLSKEKKYNAVYNAKTPVLDYLWDHYPSATLIASGESVGLPKGQMGNSEVGHTNIGAGRVVYQSLELINSKIRDKSFYNNSEILKVINHVKDNNSKLHLIGLLSDGGVHSHINHLFALLDLCKKENVKNVYVHIFTDGRDVSPTSGIKYIEALEKKLKTIGIGSIASIGGRYYGMDRDNRWDRVLKAYNAMVCGIGNKYSSYKEAILDSYDRGITDEFIEPCIIDEEGLIKDGDVVIDFNFRPDRLRELLYALSNPDFKEFDREYINIDLLTLMPVSSDVICTNAFTNQKVDTPLGVVLANSSKTQLRIAETEKYAHVTYFFDGGIERDLEGCKRILIPSPKVATYDLTPKMSAPLITEKLLDELDKDVFDAVILNYANGDMLGHTGNIPATVQGLEYLDDCVLRLYNKVVEKDGLLIITADHGNCEYMLDSEGNPVTSHSTNKVPFIICREGLEVKDGKLSDIAPTILSLMGLDIPSDMSGNVLVK